MNVKASVAGSIILLVLAQTNWTKCQTRIPPWITTHSAPINGQTFLHLPCGKAVPYRACYAIRDNVVHGRLFNVDLGNENIVNLSCNDILRIGLPCNIIVNEYTVSLDLFKELLSCDCKELFVELSDGILLSYDLFCDQINRENPKIAIPNLPILPDVDLDAISSGDVFFTRKNVPNPLPPATQTPQVGHQHSFAPNLITLVQPQQYVPEYYQKAAPPPSCLTHSCSPQSHTYQQYQPQPCITLPCPPEPCHPPPCLPQPCLPQPCVPTPCPHQPCPPEPCYPPSCPPQPSPPEPCHPPPCLPQPCPPQPCPLEPCLPQPCPPQPCSPCPPEPCCPPPCPPQPCPLEPCLPQPCPPQPCSPCPPEPCLPQPCSPCPPEPCYPPPCPPQPCPPEPCHPPPCLPEPRHPTPCLPEPCHSQPCPSQSCSPTQCFPSPCPPQICQSQQGPYQPHVPDPCFHQVLIREHCNPIFEFEPIVLYDQCIQHPTRAHPSYERPFCRRECGPPVSSCHSGPSTIHSSFSPGLSVTYPFAEQFYPNFLFM